MGISENYFKNLLQERNALEAVSILSSFWSSRALDSEKNFNLSGPEYNVQLVLIYSGEVGNGGHSQCFFSRGVVYLNDTVVALQKLGLSPADKLILKASTIITPYLGSDEDFSEYDAEALSKLDLELCDIIHKFDPLILSYINANNSSFLAPERGLV